MKPTASFPLSLVFSALLFCSGSVGQGAESKILQSPGAESIKFPAAQFHTLSDSDGLRVEGDDLVAEKTETYAAYQLVFEEPGQYYLYFKNHNTGHTANSIFAPSALRNAPESFEKWDGLASSNKEKG